MNPQRDLQVSNPHVGTWIRLKDLYPYKLSRNDKTAVSVLGMADKEVSYLVKMKDFSSEFIYLIIDAALLDNWSAEIGEELIRAAGCEESDKLDKYKRKKKQPKKEAEILGKVYF